MKVKKQINNKGSTKTKIRKIISFKRITNKKMM